MANALSDNERAMMDAYWRAANYLSIGQIYLYDNPLLKQPLTKEHIKPRLLGHWGTTPGLNFIYVHLNRVIKKHDVDMIYITGPGHGGPALVANAYLEGTYSEVYPNISADEQGMKRLFTQFSFPGGIPSHVAPETPGSIHEGGELGYALSHAYGAAFDNPDLIVACVVGDGEAETGALATSWHSNKFLDPASDGVVLPILHLNGYKIANPCILARISHEELDHLFRGYGYTPYFVEGNEPEKMHELMATTLDKVVSEIQRIKSDVRREGFRERPRWPMIVLRTPKGWTCPKEIDGKRTEDYWRSHQVPMGEMHENTAHVRILEQWMKSYRPAELFDDNGRLRPELSDLAPRGARRMSANPHTNGGLLLRELRLPNFRDYAVQVTTPGVVMAESTRVMGRFLRDVMKLNMEARNFRLFSPDENNSNRWQDVLEVTNRAWVAEVNPWDDHLAPGGRIMEMLSEHQCQGWLEGYLLTGRHGFFSCYEAFIHIIDSMFNQHAKWLKVCNHIPWRRPIGSLNYLLSSHVWRQDNNGHCINAVHDQVENHLLQLHAVTHDERKVRAQLPADQCTLCLQIVACERQDLVDDLIDSELQMLRWLAVCKRTNPFDYVACPIRVTDYAIQRLLGAGEILTVFQPALTSIAAGGNGGQRLIDFVRDRCPQLSNCRHASNPCELGLRLPQGFLRPLPTCDIHDDRREDRAGCFGSGHV
jgi:xylulose-5-phosphate/fructose-6-phosphate phosphoketolase